MKDNSPRPGFFRPRYCIVGIFLVLAGFFLVHTRHYLFYHDEFLLIRQSQQLVVHPHAAWIPNYHFRCHPLYLHVLFLENFFFGLKPMPYFAVLFLLHGSNALLIARLCRILGGQTRTAVLGGLFFLCSSSSFQALIAVHETIRVLCLFLFLLGAFSWIEFLGNSRWFSFLKAAFFQTASLMTMEDAMIFPVLMAFLSWRLVPEKSTSKRSWMGPLLILLVLDVLTLWPLVREFLLSGYRSTRVSLDASWGAKIVSLLKMLLQPLVVPGKGLLPSCLFPENFLRLVPFLVFLAVSLVLLSREGRSRIFFNNISFPLLGTAAGWIGITVAPFLGHAMPFQHASRLLYFPMVGFSMICGVFAAGFLQTMEFFRSRWGVIFCFAAVAYVLLLNLSDTAYQYQKLQCYLRQHVDQRYYDLRRQCADRP